MADADHSPPRRRKKPKGPPYLLLFLGLTLALFGIRGSNRILIGVGAALFGLALLIGYARAPGKPPA